MPRVKRPSNAVTRSAALSAPAAILGGYVAAEVARRWGVPVEVAGSAIAVLASGFTAIVAFFARGGRQGEAD